MVLGNVVEYSVLPVPEYVGWHRMLPRYVACNKLFVWSKNSGKLELVFLYIPKYNRQPGFPLVIRQRIMFDILCVDGTIDAENN